tara:strand:- start:3972 stop:4262 length:291 start_codon:yes stop_codon:yes gene_type:complete
MKDVVRLTCLTQIGAAKRTEKAFPKTLITAINSLSCREETFTGNTEILLFQSSPSSWLASTHQILQDGYVFGPASFPVLLSNRRTLKTLTLKNRTI